MHLAGPEVRAHQWSALPRVLLRCVCMYMGSVPELLVLARVHPIFHTAIHDSPANPRDNCWAQCGRIAVRLTNESAIIMDERHHRLLSVLSLHEDSGWVELARRLCQMRHLPTYQMEWWSDGKEHRLLYTRWIGFLQSFFSITTALAELVLANLASRDRSESIAYPPYPILRLRYLRCLDVSAVPSQFVVSMAPPLRVLCQRQLTRLVVSVVVLQQMCLNGTEFPSVVWLDLVARHSNDFLDWPSLPFPSLRFLSLVGCPHIATWKAEFRSEAVWGGLRHLKCHIRNSREVNGAPSSSPLPSPPLMESLRSLFLNLTGDAGRCLIGPRNFSSEWAAYKRRMAGEATALLSSMTHLEQLTIRGSTVGLHWTVELLNLLPRLIYLHLGEHSLDHNDQFLYCLMQPSSFLACRPRLTHLCLEISPLLVARAIVIFRRSLFPSLVACCIQAHELLRRSERHSEMTTAEANAVLRASVGDLWVDLAEFEKARIDQEWQKSQKLQVETTC